LTAGCASDAPRPGSGARAPLGGSAFPAMSLRSQQVVREARVPFLLLPRPYAERAIATSGEHFSALSARLDDVSLSLHGTVLVHATASPHDAQRVRRRHHVRGVPALVLVNEGIRSVTWHERGVDWTLEVECVRHETDPRCTQDAFLLELASRLEEAPR
ncbi:MAG: hypothetical protein NZ898_17280, partial [Myxococcota bacterium]|nr:hypothetical protein [Myxococcota bacterium]